MTQRQACREALRRRMAAKNLAENDIDVEMGNTSISQDEDQPDVDSPRLFEDDPPEIEIGGQPENPAPLNCRARVEEVEDEESGVQNRWIKDYPGEAGKPGERANSYFEDYRSQQVANDEDPWAPFKDEEEWELAQWLILNVGQNATDKFLKLPIVCLGICSSKAKLNCCRRHVIEPNHRLKTSARSISV